MKWKGRISSALARLAEGFLAGLVVLAVANIGFVAADGGSDHAQARRSSFLALDVLAR
ncbi:hypothetical protein [Sphingomonas parva]|uniref:hypothetical protein n=1 Tax=Sphingomonas parva TaxID=2555898 RepID=UPI00142F7B7E|nr:hypothetical protein [Sphingomonas parva]